MIRIGIVGCGRILNAHLHGYRQIREAGYDNFRITALCARNRDDALMFHKRGKGPPPRPPVMDPSTGDPLAAPHIYLDDFQADTDVAVFTDYEAMIASGSVDAVNDYTALHVHHQVGRAALSAGKHLLVEKPLAISVKAGRMMCDLAQANGLTLGLFENVRQMMPVRVAKWVVQQGLIGDLQMAFIGGIGGPWSPDKIVAETPWRHKKLLAGGGGAIDIGVHAMHWLRYVCGEVETVQGIVRTFEPVRVLRDETGQVVESVTADVDDTYLATVTFVNGAIGQMMWSWAGHGVTTGIANGPVFYGSQGSLHGDDLIAADGQKQSAKALFEAELDEATRAQWFPHGFTDPFAIQHLDWLQAIERRSQPETDGGQPETDSGQPETDGWEGLHDLAAAFAIIESSRLGRRLTLEEVLQGDVAEYQAEIDDYYGLWGE